MQECYNKHLTDFRSIICEVVAYERLKTKENSSSISGRGRLRDVVAYKSRVPNIVI